MQHLIKRNTGPRANIVSRKGGRTLAERMAANREASREEAGEPEGEEPVEDVSDPAFVAEQAVQSVPVTTAPPSVAARTDDIVAAAKAARDGRSAANGNGRTCLIVDDSRVVRKVARRIVEDLGYHAIEAENGEEALLRCRSAMPDLILTDWNMPVMTGLEFVEKLRAMPEAAEVKVVFCTSKGAVADIHHGIGAGADDYIVKPFDEGAVEAKLAKLFP